MARRRRPTHEITVTHWTPKMERAVVGTFPIGSLDISGGNGAEWLDRISIRVNDDYVSIDVRVEPPGGSEVHGPTVDLVVKANGTAILHTPPAHNAGSVQ